MKKHKLVNCFVHTRSEKRKALIPFLPAGFPSQDSFLEHILELDNNGADIIEIGVPFSDPVADGPVVEEASQECLQKGAALDWIFEQLSKIRGQLKSPLVLMGYVNPFMQFGWERLAKQASECGVDGLIIADLPLEESRPIRSILDQQGLNIIPLVGLNTSQERLALYAREYPESFIYFVSVLGTTGQRETLPAILKDQLKLARGIFTQPLVLGFGLKDPAQVKEIAEYVDGLVFGSALISHIRNKGRAKDFLAKWQAR